MTINWYRPSQCILISVTASSVVVFLGCLVCGFLLHFAPEEPSEDVNGGIYTSIPTIALLGAALLTALSLILGCWGACRDSKILLMLFSVVSFVAVVVLLASGTSVFAFTVGGQVHKKLSGVLMKDLVTYSDKSNESNIFNTLQISYDCCGVYNYTDWRDKNTTWKREQENSATLAPHSCCVEDSADCNLNETKLYSKGCVDVLVGRMQVVVYCVFGLCIILALLQSLTALSSCYSARLIQRYQSYDIL